MSMTQVALRLPEGALQRIKTQTSDKGLHGLKEKFEFIGKDTANLATYKKLRND